MQANITIRAVASIQRRVRVLPCWLVPAGDMTGVEPGRPAKSVRSCIPCPGGEYADIRATKVHTARGASLPPRVRFGSHVLPGVRLHLPRRPVTHRLWCRCRARARRRSATIDVPQTVFPPPTALAEEAGQPPAQAWHGCWTRRGRSASLVALASSLRPRPGALHRARWYRLVPRRGGSGRASGREVQRAPVRDCCANVEINRVCADHDICNKDTNNCGEPHAAASATKT